MSLFSRTLAILTVACCILLATLRHTIGAVNFVEYVTRNTEFDSTNTAFLTLTFLFMFVGYYPFAKDRTVAGLKNSLAVVTCKPKITLSSSAPHDHGSPIESNSGKFSKAFVTCKTNRREWFGLGLSMAFLSAQVALVQQNPPKVLMPYSNLNIAIAVLSSLGMNPSAYETIMRPLRRRGEDDRSVREKWFDRIFGGAWSLIGAYPTISAINKLLQSFSYARYPCSIVISAPGIMIGYEAYLMLAKLWRNERNAGMFVANMLIKALKFLWENKVAYAIALLNVIPQIGYGVVTVVKDIETPNLMVPLMAIVLTSITVSNWLTRGVPMRNYLNNLKCTVPKCQMMGFARPFQKFRDETPVSQVDNACTLDLAVVSDVKSSEAIENKS